MTKVRFLCYKCIYTAARALDCCTAIYVHGRVAHAICTKSILLRVGDLAAKYAILVAISRRRGCMSQEEVAILGRGS